MNGRRKFRGYIYQQLGHEALLQNPELYRLTPEERDLYFILRLKAGESRQATDNNDGALGLPPENYDVLNEKSPVMIRTKQGDEHEEEALYRRADYRDS